MNTGYLIRRIPLPAGELTLLQVDWDCNYFSLKSVSGNPLHIASDPEDPEQLDVLPVNAQEAVTVPWRPLLGETFRFPAGKPILWAGPVGGSDEVAVLKLIR
jgi:hypothetical protein